MLLPFNGTSSPCDYNVDVVFSVVGGFVCRSTYYVSVVPALSMTTAPAATSTPVRRFIISCEEKRGSDSLTAVYSDSMSLWANKNKAGPTHPTWWSQLSKKLCDAARFRVTPSIFCGRNDDVSLDFKYRQYSHKLASITLRLFPYFKSRRFKFLCSRLRLIYRVGRVTDHSLLQKSARLSLANASNIKETSNRFWWRLLKTRWAPRCWGDAYGWQRPRCPISFRQYAQQRQMGVYLQQHGPPPTIVIYYVEA